MSLDGWMNKKNEVYIIYVYLYLCVYTYTHRHIYVYMGKMEYYLTLISQDIKTHVTWWINPEDVILGKMNQSQKGKCIIPLIWNM